MVSVFTLLLVGVREEYLCWCLQRGAGVGVEVVAGGGVNGLTDVGVGLGALIVLKSGIAVTGVIEAVGVEVVLSLLLTAVMFMLVVLVPAVFLERWC